ncbi:hypothetical protein [Piscinibacter sp.]|uniref:hypothetical protein n=1 Tax=Piscinibacter sp. TaxID=1903157 RepID=UPI0039E5C1D6
MPRRRPEAMQELAWWLVAVLALVCAALAGLLWLRRRPGPGEPPPHGGQGARGVPAATAAREPRGGVPSSASRAPGNPLAPLPAPLAPQRNPVAALVAPPVVRLPALLVATRSRRYELRDGAAEPVLALERARADEWRRAARAAPTPMQCDALAAALSHASLLAAPAAGGDADTDLYRLTLRAGAALPLARGELAAAELRAVPAQSLDAARSPALAAIVMALHCAPLYLRRLRREVAAIRADSAGWLRRSSSADERLRALLQDLSRYLREVEENHAGAIRKPVFVARVADFCAQAEQQWQLARDAADALARRLRAGEDVAAEFAQRRLVAHCALRMLAAWHTLRLALGDAGPAATLALRGARQALRDEAGGDGEPARRALAAALQALEAGFAGEAALTLLLRLDPLGRVLEVRGPVPAE